MSRRAYLLEQIARCKRFAAAMNTDADRKKYESLAASYQNELDTLEAAEDQSSIAAETTSAKSEVSTNEAAAVNVTGAVDAAAPQPSSTDDQEPTTG